MKKKTKWVNLLDVMKTDDFTEKDWEDVDKERRHIRMLIQMDIMREKANLTQAVLAKKAGVSRDIISEIENGKRNPTFETLSKIVDALGYTIEFKEKE